MNQQQRWRSELLLAIAGLTLVGGFMVAYFWLVRDLGLW